MNRSTAVGVLLAVLGGLVLVGSAQGHARYRRSEPGDGAVVAAPPERVEIWFTQELFRRQGENWIRVFGPEGVPVHAGVAVIDDDDRTHMWVELKGELNPGVYQVEWRSLSAEDGDHDEGSFSFTFDPQAEVTSTPMRETTPTPLATPQQPQAAAPPSTPEAEPGLGGGCGLGFLPAFGLVLAGSFKRKRCD